MRMGPSPIGGRMMRSTGWVGDRDQAESHQAVDGSANRGALPAGPTFERAVRDPGGLPPSSRSVAPTERLPNNYTEHSPFGIA